MPCAQRAHESQYQTLVFVRVDASAPRTRAHESQCPAHRNPNGIPNVSPGLPERSGGNPGLTRARGGTRKGFRTGVETEPFRLYPAADGTRCCRLCALSQPQAYIPKSRWDWAPQIDQLSFRVRFGFGSNPGRYQLLSFQAAAQLRIGFPEVEVISWRFLVAPARFGISAIDALLDVAVAVAVGIRGSVGGAIGAHTVG